MCMSVFWTITPELEEKHSRAMEMILYNESHWALML